MKKVIVLMLILVMAAFTFTACNDNAKASATTKNDATNKPVATATVEPTPTTEPTETPEPTPTPVPETVREQAISGVIFTDYEQVDTFGAGAGGDPMQADTSDIAVKFTTTKPLVGLKMSCPSWSDDIGSMICRIYAWDTDYETTVSKPALDVCSLTDYPDNADVPVVYPAALEIGTYLVTLSEGEDGVGLWSAELKEGYTFFLDGEEADYAYKITLLYAK